LKPWEFQSIEFLPGRGIPEISAFCALCRTEVALSLADARPAIRLGLGLVTPPEDLKALASGAAEGLDARGGPIGFLDALSTSRPLLGELDLSNRVGLIISLDEMAEMDALEAEWREAEELASIMDGELTDVPGFESFRREILDEGS
jgi:hypothetical protein